jgi:hypothetical protein
MPSEAGRSGHTNQYPIRPPPSAPIADQRPPELGNVDLRLLPGSASAGKSVALVLPGRADSGLFAGWVWRYEGAPLSAVPVGQRCRRLPR